MTQKEDHEKNYADAESRIAECERGQLDELDLSGLALDRLPQSLGKLKHLKELDVSMNNLGVVPESIGELRLLHTLRLYEDNLRELPQFIFELSELRDLDVSYNPLLKLPPEIQNLRRLRHLRIHGNRWKEIPVVIRALKNLKGLYGHNNSFRVLPSWLGELSQLEKIFLGDNPLELLPDSIGRLSHLRVLNLENDQLRALPLSLGALSTLEALYLRGNKRLGIPDQITGWKYEDVEYRDVKPVSPSRILDYYYRIRERGTAQPLNEFKLILVGRGGVGKTTLVHRLVAGKYKQFKRTPGIKITQWTVKIDSGKVQAHVWDFGGQEIMHGTHRFFMTERALYLVLVSARENTEDHDAEYWLSLVRSFAGDDAPVIMLLHKWDDAHFELNRELLREKYGRGLVFLETDSQSGYGMRALGEGICELAKALPGLRAAWPTNWRRVKEELPKAGKNWLAFDDFCTFCREHGVEKREDHEALAASLHDLGLMLAYRKEEALREFGVLNPQWVTKGIYDMLNAPELKIQNGRFTPGDFTKLLPARKYPKVLHPYLLALMRKFRLCFPLDDYGHAYLIPDLLTKEEPKLEAEFPPEQCLGFMYRYESVLPEGLLARFIVETYVHREPKHAWRTGVILERANCRAFVRGDVLGRTVTIRVNGVGNGQRELLGIIREHFERIHENFEKLPVTEMVPVPGHSNVLVPYAELLAYEAAGDDEYKVVVRRPEMVGYSPDGAIGAERREVVKLSVKDLLDGVDIPGAPRGFARRPKSSRPGAGHHPDTELSLFISYSHRDELFRDELHGALTPYQRLAELEIWDDTRIEAGQKWEPEIVRNLEHADIIVLLVSNDFIRSDYCMLKEMEIAKERDAASQCAIVPIVVRACAYQKLELGQLQAILPGGKPIKQHRDRDAAWLAVTKQLDRVIARLRGQRTGVSGASKALPIHGDPGFTKK